MTYYFPEMESVNDFKQTLSNIFNSIDCVDKYKCNFVLPIGVEVYNPIKERSSIWATPEMVMAKGFIILKPITEQYQKIGTDTAAIIMAGMMDIVAVMQMDILMAVVIGNH